jgi:hypothetical protein
MLFIFGPCHETEYVRPGLTRVGPANCASAVGGFAADPRKTPCTISQYLSTGHSKLYQEVLGITNRLLSFRLLRHGSHKIPAFNSSNIVACVFVAAGTLFTEPLPSNLEETQTQAAM